MAHSRLLVSAGAVSALSWYAAIILGTWKSLTLSYVEIMAGYLAILAVMLVGANIAITIFSFGFRSGHKLRQEVGADKTSRAAEGAFKPAYSISQPTPGSIQTVPLALRKRVPLQ